MRQKLGLLIFFLSCASFLIGQSEHQGVKLYRDGKYSEARGVLNAAVKDEAYKTNAALWNYLGLACLGEKDYKNGRKAFEKAVKLAPAKTEYHSDLAYAYLLLRDLKKARSASDKALSIDARNVTALIVRGTANYWSLQLDDAERDVDRAIAINDHLSDGYFLKSNIIVARLARNVVHSDMKKELPLLESAAEVLKTGIDKCVPTGGCKDLTDEYEGMVAFVQHFQKKNSNTLISADTPSAPEPDVTPLKITSKPRPAYTDKARQSNTQGTIQMAALFGTNGRVQHVLLLKRLGNGLDEEAVRAARRIQFQPEMKGGKPIAVVKQLEYSFSIY